MSYRPSVKTDQGGATVDFPLDAETIRGKSVGFLTIANASGTLTSAQYSELTKDIALIKYGNKVFYKEDVDSSNKLVFVGKTNTSVISNTYTRISQDIVTIDTTTRAYQYIENALINTYTNTQIDTKLSEVRDDIPTALSQLSADSTHRLVTDTEKSTWNGKQSALTFDDTPTANSNNPVKSSGIKTYVDNAVNDVVEIAEGKTKNYVISDVAISGYVNSSFNSTNETIALTIGSNKVRDISGNDVALSSLKVGDIVSITETSVPDRWVGSITSTTITFYKMETKIDVVNAITQNDTRPITSGAVYTGMQTKQNVINSSNKLSADLVDDTSTTHKFVSATEKTTWNNKYDKPSTGIPTSDLADFNQIVITATSGTFTQAQYRSIKQYTIIRYVPSGTTLSFDFRYESANANEIIFGCNFERNSDLNKYKLEINSSSYTWEITTVSLINSIYPVGSIYMSVNSTSPSTLFGGTWERLKDRFLLGCGDTYSNGATGGEATHTLTVSEMPSHTHFLMYQTGTRYGSRNNNLSPQDAWLPYNTAPRGWDTDMSYEGGDQPHNNMPPYLAVYMWKRTA